MRRFYRGNESKYPRSRGPLAELRLATIASLSCTFGYLFKLNSLTTAITKGDISLAEKFIRNNRSNVYCCVLLIAIYLESLSFNYLSFYRSKVLWFWTKIWRTSFSSLFQLSVNHAISRTMRGIWDEFQLNVTWRGNIYTLQTC